MQLFHIIDDTQVILRSRGVYKQVPMYRQGEELFAKHGSGFVKLCSNKGTTAPSVSWVDMDKHDEIEKTGGHCNNPQWIGGVSKR